MSRPRPPALRRHPGHPAAVTPVPVDRTGRRGPTAKQARGSGWRRTATNLYVPAHVDPDLPIQRIVEAAAVLPEYGGVTGWAALHWMGAGWFDGRDGKGTPRRVALAIGPANLRPDSLRLPSKERLAPRDLTCHDALAVTTAIRSLTYEMRYAPWRQAVAHLDMAARADLVSLAEVRRYVDTWLQGWTGVPVARMALDHGDENAWSPMEVEMRLLWTVDAGLPRPLTNRPVFDLDGRHIGTPDLLDPVAGVAGEYDGAVHLDGERRHRDLIREEGFRAAGLEVVTMVAADRRDPSAFIHRLQSTYARGAARLGSARRWTTALPPYWVPTHSVERRRALRGRAA